MFIFIELNGFKGYDGCVKYKKTINHFSQFRAGFQN